MKTKPILKAKRVSVFLLFPILCACDPMKEIRGFLGLGEKTTELPAEMRAEMKSADSTNEVRTSEGLVKENQELLSEMIRVVFDRNDSEDQADFDALARTLNQGASLEGIYRGIIMGSRYRALESNSQAAAPAVLKVFSSEMAELQEGMREPTRFDPEQAKLAPRIEYPSEPLVPLISFPSSSPSPSSVDPDRPLSKSGNFQALLRIFVGASPYTLKRVLAEEALKRFEEAGGDPSAIPLWYAGLAVRLSGANVDFGLELRRKPDFEFHKAFAKKIAMDRVKWEVLNRYHRLLNAVKKTSG
ncbi:MAG: hypothetical protein KGP28_11830 [Bdellovibrionales bacterium]|nr:hypothetical protein [Bdellovibrionales bacterium]